MSYTPTTWTTGDTITASALNKIENGVANAGSVATVCVDITDGTLSGSQYFVVAYAQHINNVYSIESPMTQYYTIAPYQGICYVTVPLTDAEDDFKPYILWEWGDDNMHLYTITGNISTTKITANKRIGASLWESVDYKGFEIMGDGKIVVSYYD